MSPVPAPPAPIRRRRTLALAVGLVLLVGGLASCGDDGSAETKTTSVPPEHAEYEPSPTEPFTVLVTNDDGYAAEGIDVVVEALKELDDIELTVVAPLEQKSGSGGTYTEGDVAVTDVTTASGFPAKAVDGFPADAVRAAFEVGGLKPHLVVSGINEGQNIGPLVDVSGTVGAAREAVARGVPALAVSSGIPEPEYDEALPYILEWIDDRREELIAGDAPVQVDSMNVPSCRAGNVRGLVEVPVATDGDALGDQDCNSFESEPEDDVTAFANGFATLSVVPDEPETPPTAATTEPEPVPEPG